MRKYKSVEFQFDPEIERIARRLRRERRELQTAVAMDDLQDLRNLNRIEEIQPVDVHEGLNGHCVQKQLGNNNIIHMANDRDRAIRDYTVLTPQAIHPGIVKPDVQAENFELKPVMFQMLQTVGQFNGLPSEDPHLHFKLFLELETFYNGLKPSTRLMVDASANGAFLSKSYNEAYEILEMIANNNYQCPSTRQAAVRGTAGVHNVDALTSLSAQVTSLTKMVKAMTTSSATVNQIYDVPCFYCGKGHLFDNCPGNPTSVNYVGSFNRQNQDNPYSNTYKPGWRQHPNFSWSYQNQTAAAPSGHNRLAQPPRFYQQNQEKISINNDQLSSLEGLIKDYIMKNETVVQSHTAYLRNLENQIGQLATAVSNRPQGSLPSNTENPRRERKEHCKVINLRSRNEADSSVGIPNRRIKSNQGQEDTQVEKKSQSSTFQNANKHNSATASAESYDPASGGEEAITPTATEPSRAKEKQFAQPAAAQQFRHPPLFPQSRMLQSKIPQKMKNLGSFTIPCSIGTEYSGKALCDLGASIKGKIEDVLVKVDKFIFPVDFIVLDFEADKEVPIILGRPFLATGKTLIDVQKGELTMRVNDQQVTFNMLDAMKSPDEIEDCNFINVVDFVVAERLHSCCSKEEINVVTFEELDDENHRAANIAWSREKQPFRIDE
ncbi:hypothetical protein KPL71_025809 [Citrus sinensis]|uniref:Uncharacterized protein n=1 Tax=Citrus sinensis TaxID=2711 RepID=A0ACB8HWJ2_CITSI|nr:hypothetical protein KPL71_025809 [Citrus sinensis]